MIKPSSVSEDDSIKLGSIVSGIIDTITSQAVIVRVKSKSVVKGTISAEHLADHHEQAKLIMSLLRPGYELDKLLVLGMLFTSYFSELCFLYVHILNAFKGDCLNVHSSRILFTSQWLLMDCRERNIFMRVVLSPSDYLVRLHISGYVVSKTNQNI
jgi:hypothetical protein